MKRIGYISSCKQFISSILIRSVPGRVRSRMRNPVYISYFNELVIVFRTYFDNHVGKQQEEAPCIYGFNVEYKTLRLSNIKFLGYFFFETAKCQKFE